MSAVYILVALISYLIGSISFAIIFSKKMAGFDVREKGSYNAGATNVLRTVGKKAAILTLICDSLKGVLSILIAMLAAKIWTEVNLEVLKYLAGLFAIIGHTIPIYYGFRGGKGVATALRSIINGKSSNRSYMLSFCINYNDCHQMGFSRFNFSSNFIPYTYSFYDR